MENATFCLLRRYRLPVTFTRYIHSHAFRHPILIAKPSIVAPNIFQNKAIYESTYTVQNDSLLKRLKLKLTDGFIKNAKLGHSASRIYEKCADGLEYDKLFEYFQLPDTFQSWFLLLQLHVWMCIVRVISEQHGKTSKKCIIESMWCDVEIRLGKLTIMKGSVKKKYLIDMNSQFRAALISYDEGLFGDDAMLAAAVWRTLYSFNCKDPRLLESAVIYIRQQLSHLDSLNTENLMYRGQMSWLPLTAVLPVFTVA